MEAGLPSEDSALAAEGTLLHSYSGNPALDREVLRPGQRDLLRIVDEIDAFVFERVHEQFKISPDVPFEEGYEKELWVKGEDGSPQISGHCDRWRSYYNRKLVVILERKFGFRIVEPAEANLQTRTYAVGARDEWPDVERVVVAIGQPRLPYEQRITIAGYERDDIESSRKQLLEILAASQKADAPLNAGEIQCRYCLARMFCPALKAKIDSGLSIITLGGDGTVAKRQAEAAELLAKCSDVQLDRVLVAIQLSDFVKEPARDEGRRRVEAGQLSNWTLGKASEIRKIIDAKRAVSLLTLRGDLSKDDVLGCATIKIGDLEEKLREKKKCTWSESRKVVEETLAPVMERESKRPSLTRKKE